MDPAERGGVEWVSEFCPVKGSIHGPMGRAGHGPGLGLQFGDINGLRTGLDWEISNNLDWSRVPFV